MEMTEILCLSPSQSHFSPEPEFLVEGGCNTKTLMEGYIWLSGLPICNAKISLEFAGSALLHQKEMNRFIQTYKTIHLSSLQANDEMIKIYFGISLPENGLYPTFESKNGCIMYR